MKLYSVDVAICATAYIKADSHAEALAAARELYLASPDILDSGGDLPVSGTRYSDPDLPDVSLSPAMTCYGPWSDVATEFSGKPPARATENDVDEVDDLEDVEREDGDTDED